MSFDSYNSKGQKDHLLVVMDFDVKHLHCGFSQSYLSRCVRTSMVDSKRFQVDFFL